MDGTARSSSASPTLIRKGTIAFASESAAGCAVTGDDANSGLSANEAWQRVSHAMSAVPAGSHVVHLAPGVYSDDGGELYPLTRPEGMIFKHHIRTSDACRSG